MDRLVRHWIPAFIAIIVCLLVLAGLRGVLVEWAVIVAAFAFLLGLFNVFGNHFRKALRLGQGGLHSLVFLGAALVSLGLSLVGPEQRATRWMFDHIISPVGASLAALVVFTLTLAAFRLLRTRRNDRAESIVFIVVVAIVLLGGFLEPLSGVRDWVVNVLGMAGVRGLLLGVALGTVITALRVLWPRSES